MKAIIKADDDELDDIDMELTNEGLNNPNFVTIYVDGKEYMVSVTDLYHASKLFFEVREQYRKENI